jgi:hypothetical protein
MVILIILWTVSKTILVKHLNEYVDDDLNNLKEIFKTILVKNLDSDLNNIMDSLENDFGEIS